MDLGLGAPEARMLLAPSCMSNREHEESDARVARWRMAIRAVRVTAHYEIEAAERASSAPEARRERITQALGRAHYLLAALRAEVPVALRWKGLSFGHGAAPEFDEQIVQPIRRLADRTLDARAIAAGILFPGDIASRVVSELDRRVFGGATLQDLPADGPEFVINATNLESGVLFRLSRKQASDYRVGTIPKPTLRLAEAVVASAAFPPFLSPLELDLTDAAFKPGSGEDLQQAPYTDVAELTDGGVYDNLGLETAFKNFSTVLVSDGGGQFRPNPDPDNDWFRHMVRVLQVMDRQVRSLRKRQLIAAYESNLRKGAYWGIGTDIAHYDPPPSALLPAPHAATFKLATIPTRLARLEPHLQERLINWGYAVSDAALRTHLERSWQPPTGFPYPASGVGEV